MRKSYLIVVAILAVMFILAAASVSGVSAQEPVTVTVPVELYNGGSTLGSPHAVEVNGVGTFSTGDQFMVPSGTTVSYRLRRGGVVNDWQSATFPDALDEGKWRLQFATVTVALHNDGTSLTDDIYAVEISGVGTFHNSETFHVPPDVELSYRLRRGGVVNDWLHATFSAGDTNPWSLEFATVTPYLHNGDTTLAGSVYSVEISGVGTFNNGETFHVPPGVELSYRLRRGGIVGPWQHMTFSAGDLLSWPLEFATVVFTFDQALPGDLANLMSTEVNGATTVPNNGSIHLPPGVAVSFRARRGGWTTGWFSQVFVAGDGTVIWRLGPTYVPPA